MFWQAVYLVVALLLTLIAVALGVSSFKGGWIIHGASVILAPLILITLGSALLFEISRRVSGPALRIGSQIGLATFALLGAAFGQAVGFLAGVDFYGDDVQLAQRFLQLFSLGALLALAPGAIFAAIAAAVVKLMSRK